MSTEEHIAQLTAQITTLQAQLTHCSWSPPPPQPSAAPPPPLKPPKVSAPSPFSGAQDDLDCFKAKCSLYLSMRQSEFPDEHSNVLFILLYMKGGSAGPWATQKINSILRSEEHTSELQSLRHLVCRLLLEKKKQTAIRSLPLGETTTPPTRVS